MTKHRALRVEQLEHRLLLTGDTYLINFQDQDAVTPTRYAADIGQQYGLRSNGLTYGWSSDHTDVDRERDVHPDQRLDTLVHFHLNQKWELAVPDGLYSVTVSIGDPSVSSTHTINVEGTAYWSGVALEAGQFLNQTQVVNVTGGRLTLDQGNAGEMSTRINYVHVVGLPNGPNNSPDTPTIMEPVEEGHVVNPADVHMEAVGFSDSDGNQHLSTDWEIWRVGDTVERVWHTLGITGVERYHTHLGDGIFENSHAGRTSLISDTVPNFDFNTYTLTLPGVTAGDQLTITAEMIDAMGGSGASISGMVDNFVLASPNSANLMQDGSFEQAIPGTQITNSNWVLTTEFDGEEESAQFQAADWAANDGSTGIWFKGFRGSQLNPVDAAATQIVTANVTGDYVLSFDARVEEFFKDVIGGFRVTITSSGTGGSQTIDLLDTFTPEYELRVRFRDDAGSVSQYATRRFIAADDSAVFPLELEDVAAVPAPQWRNAEGNAAVILPPAAPNQSVLRLEGNNHELLLAIAGNDGLTNSVTNPAGLEEHVDLRVAVIAGSAGLQLPETDVQVFDDHGGEHKVSLPAIDLAANERLDLWVSTDGSTYYGTAAQTEPTFTSVARYAEGVPFVALEPGFIIEQVAGGFQLPVNMAFVPNPGPNPDDPLFYVNELYGTIKVVTNDFTVSTYATGLLNFDPTGFFPGSGEQGLAGLAIDPVTGDLFVSRVTDTDGLPSTEEHHPQVVRLHSNDGGRTAATITVIRDMVGETQGQSHQVSNVTIGPDGKLYVHNGDGFNATTALNLNSYRGKILRMNLDGTAPSDNPLYNAANGITATDYIYAYGFRNPFGGAWRASDGKHYEVENGNSVDRLARVDAGGNYDWNGSDASLYADAKYIWDPAVAPVNIAFVQPETFGGSQFPDSKQDHAFVSESGPTYWKGQTEDGKRILEFELDANGNVVGTPTPFIEYVGSGQATVSGLAAGPDGLYFTDLYKDRNPVSPIEPGARIFRIKFAPAGNGDFNGDGTVNAADYTVWRDNVNTSVQRYSSADGDGDGMVTRADYQIWKDNFGRTLGVYTTVGGVALSAGEAEQFEEVSAGTVAVEGDRVGYIAVPSPAMESGRANLLLRPFVARESRVVGDAALLAWISENWHTRELRGERAELDAAKWQNAEMSAADGAESGLEAAFAEFALACAADSE